MAQTFDMPNRTHVVGLDLDIAKRHYMDDTTKALQVINSWLEKPKPHFSKFPKQLHKAKFISEYYDAITLLSRVMGLKIVEMFENWMFNVIVRMEKNFDYQWSGIINARIHEKFCNVSQSKSFTMTSYLVHALARFHPYKWLSERGIFG